MERKPCFQSSPWVINTLWLFCKKFCHHLSFASCMPINLKEEKSTYFKQNTIKFKHGFIILCNGIKKKGFPFVNLVSSTLYSYHNYICPDVCKNGLGYGNFCRKVLTQLWLKPIFKSILIHPNTLCISGFPDSVFWLLMYRMNFPLLLLESLCAVTFYWHFLLTCS